MRLVIDTDRNELVLENREGPRTCALYSKEGFEALSRLWLKVGWNQKYPHTFSWLGRPVIQLPEDLVRTQEVVYQVQPDVIVETGVAHGGSLVFYASLCRSIDKGRVIGIDIEIRPHNRAAIEQHSLFPYITLFEGSSINLEVLAAVRSKILPGETVLVILDSNHSRRHVLAELEAYSPLVTLGSYIVATDGVMQDLHDVPRGKPEWRIDHPCAAVEEFLATHPQFQLEQPSWPFSESDLTENVTYWPKAWLKRVA